MWLKENASPPPQKSFNVETINFTEKKKGVEVVSFGSCHLVREGWEHTKLVQMVSSPTWDVSWRAVVKPVKED